MVFCGRSKNGIEEISIQASQGGVEPSMRLNLHSSWVRLAPVPGTMVYAIKPIVNELSLEHGGLKRAGGYPGQLGLANGYARLESFLPGLS